MNNKSLKTNAILNAVKQFSSIIFPLITFPYVSRVLGVENYGKISFGNSVISYFALIAALGITTYAIREGSELRDDKEKVSKFSSEIFSINMLSTIFSYVCLFLLLIFWDKLHPYQMLLIIQSTIILFNILSVDWVYNIYEEYKYITIRSIIIQLLSLVLMFVFVRQQSDYYVYAVVTVISVGGGSLFNFIHSRKYLKLKLTSRMNLGTHLSPMIVMFSNTVMISIYVNSDTTILGILTDNFTVGTYSVAAKIYTIVKQLLNALIVVTLPRLSYYRNSGEIEEYQKLLRKIIKGLIIIVFPTFTGLFMESKNIILLIAGEEYLGAVSSLRLLCLALVFAMIGGFFSTSVMLTSKRENMMLKITVVSALVNLGLNFVFIPLFSLNGAAITTIIAEAVVAILAIYNSRDIFKYSESLKNIIFITFGCTSIILVSWVMGMFSLSPVIHLAITIPIAAVAYFLILLFSKNELVVESFQNIVKKIKK